MNKFFLTFDSPELESEYQLSQTKNVKKPIYMFMIAGLLAMNLITVAYNFFFAHVQVWYLNLGFSIYQIAQIIIFVVKKKMKYFQLAITLTSFQIGVLQLNIGQAKHTGSEFYSYGSTFMQYQAVLYLISDFPYAVAQFIGNFAMKMAFTIILSSRMDSTLIINGIAAVFLLSITTYVKDKNERKNFVRGLKDCHMNKISSFLIREPHFKIILNQNNMLFDVTQHKLIESFPEYNSEYCNGCNVRHMLRNYVYEEKTIEQWLLNKDNLSMPAVFQIACHKKKFKIRVCEAEITQLSYFVILEEISSRIDEFRNINNETSKLKTTLLHHNRLFLQKFFNWGVLSVIMLQRMELKQVDVRRMFQKLVIIFQSQLIQEFDIVIKSSQDDYQINTYNHQLKIFMIQFFNVLLKSQTGKRVKIIIRFKQQLNTVDMILSIQNAERFTQLFSNNYFIRQTKRYLAEEITSTGNTVIFSLKSYPHGSFYQKTRLRD